MIGMKKNIVLIGMPGCGKTTIGIELSRILNLDFCDIDEYIVSTQGKPISEIFINGEDHFRNIETEAVEEVSKTFPKIISTGGGVVKRARNIDSLKENGTIIYIHRPIENIASDVDIKSRPLLKDGVEKLYKLYEERYPLYEGYCDYKVENINIEKCIKEIISFV
jgi:shikimate kinase